MPFHASSLLQMLLTSARLQPLRLALFALLIAVISWLALSPHPPSAVSTGWDKSNHALAFAALMGSGRLAWPGPPWLAKLMKLAIALLAYGVLIELLQAQIPGREADAWDVLADLLGIVIGAAVHALVVRV